MGYLYKKTVLSDEYLCCLARPPESHPHVSSPVVRTSWICYIFHKKSQKYHEITSIKQYIKNIIGVI